MIILKTFNWLKNLFFLWKSYLNLTYIYNFSRACHFCESWNIKILLVTGDDIQNLRFRTTLFRFYCGVSKLLEGDKLVSRARAAYYDESWKPAVFFSSFSAAFVWKTYNLINFRTKRRYKKFSANFRLKVTNHFIYITTLQREER